MFPYLFGVTDSQKSGHLDAHVLIATQTVGAGGAASVTFSSIPQTYKWLQVRVLAKNTTTTADGTISINSGALSYRHSLSGDGATATSTSGVDSAVLVSATSTTANLFAVNVLDILDYTNTSRNKTIRALGGVDYNGSGNVSIRSGLYSANTNAITSIAFSSSGTSFAQNSLFSLYGVS